jgi:predicted RNase H-like HicB family nuclease
MKYAIVIEKAQGGNYSAYVPDLPGCIATADTLDEIKPPHAGRDRVPS